MVQFWGMMNTADSQETPAPPSLIQSLMAGFDVVANHISLILIPVALDLLLWFGPHWRIYRLVQGFQTWATSMPVQADAPAQALAGPQSLEELVKLVESYNLLGMLRSLPVGVPSLMVSEMPVKTPWGVAPVWEVPSWLGMIGLSGALLLVGLVIGTLYYGLVAQAALMGKINLRQALVGWPWAVLQVLLLALVWLGVLLMVSLPFLCIGALALTISVGLFNSLALFYAILLTWMFLPLVFSAHAIFAYQAGAWEAVREGVRLTRMTFPSTGMFLLTAFIFSEGLDLLWGIPQDSSWLFLIGILGHAFITTGLLAASFIYYCGIHRWLKKVIHQA